MATGPWTFQLYRPDTETNYEVNVAFPKNLSITGLKNLVHEKTEIPSNKLKLTFTDEATGKEKEVHESSEKLGHLFLRDYSTIKNGCKFSISQDNAEQ